MNVEPRIALSQWGASASAVLAALGLLWGIISYVQMISSDVAVMKADIAKLLNADMAMQERLSRDHDALIKLETELAEHMKQPRDKN